MIRIVAVVLVAGAGLSVSVEGQAFQCSNVTPAAPVVRAEGHTELLGDIVLDCTGGAATPPNQTLYSVNISVNLNTSMTSESTADFAGFANIFSEALLLIDEPGSPAHPTVPILNCGNSGAPDTSAAGPSVCSVMGAGALGAASMYDGSPGHPNAFQGRAFASITGQFNQVLFLSIPIDPPGTVCANPRPAFICHRILRITNLRGDAAAVGTGLYSSGQINAQIITNPVSGLPIDNGQSVLANVVPGLTAAVTGSNGATSPIRIFEGFAGAWKTKNVSAAVGDHNAIPGNATLQGSTWVYNGGANYPADDAQNVPGISYHTESGFEWRNNSTNAPPSPNPPPGYGGSPVPNLGNPLISLGLGGLDTGINKAGFAHSATRVALRFNNIPSGGSIQVPQRITLYRQGCNLDPSCSTGLMVLTSADPAGAGPFVPSFNTTLTSSNNTAVYEILYTDPLNLEFADVPFTLNGGSGAGLQVTVGFAPFYSQGGGSEQVSSTYPVPRFVDRAASAPCTSLLCLGAFPNPTSPGSGASLSCSNSTSAPPLIRAEGIAEMLGDIILDCQGGTPTPAGQPVPQVTFSVAYDVPLTARLTAGSFTEALLMVDEPRSPLQPDRPILNCGHDGAADTGPSGPGVCAIMSTGDPGSGFVLGSTYNGVLNGFGAGAFCDGANGRPAPNSYGCGRPNVFQGQLDPTRSNAITFVGVPIDPPGPDAHRIIRITNVRANAASLGVTAVNTTRSITASISTLGSNLIAIDAPQRAVAAVTLGLIAPVSPNSSVHLQEGYNNAWKTQNIAVSCANGTPRPVYSYGGGTSYPPQAAQSVPGAVYDTESGFQYQNDSLNKPLDTPINPLTCSPVSSAGYPLASVGFGGLNTGITAAGVATSGTRFALRFSNVPPGASIQVPTSVPLVNVITHTVTGVIVLTNADSNGAGPYSPASGTLTASNVAVYEVLFANPNALEAADISYTLLDAPPDTAVQVTTSFAPFYSTAAAGQSSAILPVPRFEDSLAYVPCVTGPCISVSPSEGTNSGPVNAALTGGPILNNAQVRLSGPGFPDILGTSTSNVGPSVLSTTLDLTGATAGARDVLVTPQTGAPFTLAGAFTILAAPPCSFVVGPLNPTLAASGGSGSLVVTPSAPSCAWNASTSTPWITLLPKSPTVQPYTVDANPNTTPRDGTISIAGKTVTVSQTGACTYDISPISQIFSASGGSLTVNVLAPAGCSWSAASNTSWIAVTGAASGSGIGSVTLQADLNSGGLRSGTVTIAGKTFSASQSASGCGAADVSSQVTVARGAFTSNFTGTNYLQQVRLTNPGPAIPGPVYLVVDGLPMTGTPCVGGTCGIVPPPQITFCQSPSGSSLVVAAPNGLAVGQAVNLTLTFSPGRTAKGVPPTWTTTRVFSGTPGQ